MKAPNAEVRLLSLGGEESIAYILRHTGRRKSVGIFVEPNGSLSVLAPADAGLNRVEQILRRRQKWIRRQQREVEALPPPPQPREWVAGETHRYLGRQYRLKPIDAREESVRLLGAYFVVLVPNRMDRERIKALMEQWYREHARLLFLDRNTP